MIRVGLLDTTVPGAPGSMARYRDQLVAAFQSHVGDQVKVSTEFLGCEQRILDRLPARLRMWRRHHHIWNAARKLDVTKFDVIHLLDGSFGYVALAVQSPCVVVTVHDVIPRLQMDGVFAGAPSVGPGAKWLIQRSLKGVRKSCVVCSDSESTANDLRTYQCLPVGGIEIVPLAIETELFAGKPVSHQDLGVPGPFLFHLGNNGFYKNRAGAIEILKRMSPELQCHLVLAGPGPDDSLRRIRDASGISDRIHFVTDPDQRRLAQYYRAASAFVFPSLYEGFGWPPLEAMAAGCPVVSSDAGSLPEVVSPAGIVAPSGDYQAMARGCDRLMSDAAFRYESIAAGQKQVERFSRKRLADNMLDAYRHALGVKREH